MGRVEKSIVDVVLVGTVVGVNFVSWSCVGVGDGVDGELHPTSRNNRMTSQDKKKSFFILISYH